tara:strand:+ start:63 stop:230 length:168 start_codon:yes stop_codon:yes gene_type:complete
MPRYDYICNNDNCETEIFEVLKSNFELTVERCVKCGTQSKNRKSVYQFNFSGFGE